MKYCSVLNRRFFPILFIYFIDTFGLALVYPIFTPLFLKPQLHLLYTQDLFQRTFLLGLLIASFPLAQMLGSPFIGALSDRIGRKKVFIGTITGGIIGYFLTGFGIHMREISLLWIGRATTGFFASNLTLCLATIADITDDKQFRARNFGWIGIMGGLGFVLAILVGGSLSNPNLDTFFKPDIPFFITGLLSCVSLFLLKFFKEVRKTKPHDTMDFFKSFKNLKKVILKKEIRDIYIAYFLFIVCWVTSMQFLSTYLIDVFHVSTNLITLTFVCIGLSWSFANFFLNRILSHFFLPSRTFFISLLFLSAFLYATLIPNQPLFFFLIHFFIATLAAALAWTNGLATLSIQGSSALQGSILGINQSIVAIASICGPIIGGTLAGLDVHALYFFTASCSLTALVIFLENPYIKSKK